MILKCEYLEYYMRKVIIKEDFFMAWGSDYLRI